MKKQIIFILGLLCLFAGVTPRRSHAVLTPSGPQGMISVNPTFQDNGNVFRYVSSTPTAFAIPISSSPNNVSTSTTGSPLLGIDNFRGRYVVNLCTAAEMAIVPAPSVPRIYDTYRTTFSITLASAPARADGSLIGGMNGANSAWLTTQAELWGVWNTGSEKCIYGTSVMEQFYLPPGNDEQLRKVGR